MKSSDSIKALAEALSKAQAAMGGAVKDAKNPFFKSNYADLTSVIKAIKQPLSDNGIAYTQFPISNENGVGVVSRLMHKSGEWMENSYTLPLVKRDPQAAGSAITYARRYALQSIMGIPTADDDAESAMVRSTASVDKAYTDAQKAIFEKAIKKKDALSFWALKEVSAEEAYMALFGSFEPGTVTRNKEVCRKLESNGAQEWNELVTKIERMIKAEDAMGLAEEIEGFEEHEKRYLVNRIGKANSDKLGDLVKSVPKMEQG